MNALQVTRLAAAVCAWALVAGCAGLVSRQEPPPASTAPPVETPAVDAGDSSPADSDPQAAISHEVGTPDPVMVPCIIPPTPKTKVKPRAKAVSAEPPPSQSETPAVPGNRPAGLVDARVQQMPVSVMSILGKRVQSPTGEDLGRVVDVLADDAGRVRVAIIDFGGFLGVGARRIAVDWPLLRFEPNGKEPSLELGLTREQLQKAPEYKDNPRPQTLAEPQAPAPGASDAKQ